MEYLVHAITKDDRLISFTVSAQNHQVAIVNATKEHPEIKDIVGLVVKYDIKEVKQ